MAVSESKEVADNVAISALAAQNEFGVNQSAGQNFWDPAKTFGEIIAKGQLKADDTAGIQKALDTLVDGASAPAE